MTAAIPQHPQKNERLSSLRKLNVLDTPIEERYERLTRMACRILNVPIAAFTLVDKDRQWFKSIQGLSGSETPIELSFCSHVTAADAPMLVSDASKDERFADNPLVTGNPNIAFYAGFPVHCPEGKPIGAFCAIDTKARTFDPEQMEALRDLAVLVENELKLSTLAQQQSNLIHELDAAQRLALIDPLTRLWNRAGLDEILKREWAEGSRRHVPLALVMADIDHFKKVNDTYGHPAGDEVIKTVAKRLLASLRTEDAIGRMGGEEFLMVMPHCDPAQLKAILERIRESLVASPIKTEAGEIPVTISYGAAHTVPDKSHTFEDVIKRADDALYKAKQGGRNRVVLAD